MCHPLESHFSFGSLLRIPTRNVQIRCELILVSFCAFVSKSASATGNLPSSAGFLTIPTVDSNRINHCCHFSERWHHKSTSKLLPTSIMALTSPGIALDKAVLQSMHLAGSKDMSRLCQTARSAAVVFTDLLLACCLVNATLRCCKFHDHSDLHHCLSVTCILSCCLLSAHPSTYSW